MAFAAGSIPACAGETVQARQSGRRPGVYPRVCGGNNRRSSPTPGLCGLSPRVRGKRPQRIIIVGNGGSIPACAGETRPPRETAGPGKVYPRVCGGNRIPANIVWSASGLSPRVRGKRPRNRRGRNGGGSIPACAGETDTMHTIKPVKAVYPRVCGGNGNVGGNVGGGGGLSPRVRGKQPKMPIGAELVWSIPACAGETAGARGSAGRNRVYPRVCGGNPYPFRCLPFA